MLHERQIHWQSIRLINDIMEQTEQQDVPGILLLLDFRKAFDTIEWNFIQQTLSVFNFGPWLIMDSQHNFF